MHPAPVTGLGAKRSRGRHATRDCFGHKGVVSPAAAAVSLAARTDNARTPERRTRVSLVDESATAS